MTRTQKIVVVALALVVLLFAWVTWHGAHQPACPGGPSSDAACQPGAGTRAIATLLAPFGGGVQLPQKTVNVPFDALETVKIPPSSDEMRRLNVTLVSGAQGAVGLVNVAPSTLAPASQGDEARLPDPTADASARMSRTYVVTSQGATLKLRCLVRAGCVFEGG